MAGVRRFGISLPDDLLDKFDRYIRAKKYTSRSKAVADLMRRELIKDDWQRGGEVAGAVTLIYNHHGRELLGKITDIQHDYQKEVISTQHIHLDHDNCLEIVAFRGRPASARKLTDALRAIKGVKHVTLSMSGTGKGIE